MDNIDKLLGKGIFIGVGKTPWHYHYGDDNYLPLAKDHSKHLGNCNFLKLSKKISISEWEQLPSFASEFLNLTLSVLSSTQEE